MARHVAVRGESACARRGRRPRPFRGSPRPRPARRARGVGGACRAPAWGGAGEGARWRGRKPARARGLGAGCGARRPPSCGGRAGSGRVVALGPCCNDCAARGPPPQDRFAVGSDCCRVVAGTARRPLNVPAVSGFESRPAGRSLSSGGSRVGVPRRPDGVAAARAVPCPSGARASGDSVCCVAAFRYPGRPLGWGMSTAGREVLRSVNGVCCFVMASESSNKMQAQ